MSSPSPAVPDPELPFERVAVHPDEHGSPSTTTRPLDSRLACASCKRPIGPVRKCIEISVFDPSEGSSLRLYLCAYECLWNFTGRMQRRVKKKRLEERCLGKKKKKNSGPMRQLQISDML